MSESIVGIVPLQSLHHCASTRRTRLQLSVASARRRLAVPKRVHAAAAHALQLQMAVSAQLRT
eukprot:8312549-Pyramimonas_sp.AAC.1